MPQTQLPRSSPESQGIASTSILSFVDAIEQARLELHSLMLVRHGQVVAEGWWRPYSAGSPHVMFSLSKSFCATAAGIAVAEGLFSLDDKVVDLFPDDLPIDIGANLAAMRVRDLLSMSTGHADDTTATIHAQDNWARAFLALPVEHAPGTHFLYNSGATYMVSAIVQQKTGMRMLEYLRTRLFEPLGIENPSWQTCPRGIDTGGWGLRLRTEDIAKFGELYLRKGVWRGKRLLSDSWVEQATSKQVSNGDSPDNDWNQGYGFQFWRCRHNSYRGDGAFGQFCIVMPDQDAVLAITSGLGDMQSVMNLAWSHLLGEMKRDAMVPNPVAADQLLERLADLQVSVPDGTWVEPPTEALIGNRYRFAQNDLGINALSLDFDEAGLTARIVDVSGTHTIRAGFKRWEHSEAPFACFVGDYLHSGPSPIAAGAAWTSPNTLTTKICLYETPFHYTANLTFSGSKLILEVKLNVSFGQSEWPPIESL